MSRALPPVGTHSTALQLGHTTTVCEWLNTVVLRVWDDREEVSREQRVDTFAPKPRHERSSRCRTPRGTHIVKHPWHFTSMK